MKTPTKFVSPLTTDSVNELQSLIKHASNSRVRTRAQAIWWSSQKYTMDQISQLCDVNRDTVSIWIDKWEQLGLDGLYDQPRPGGPCLLTDGEKSLVMELVQQAPRSIAALVAQLGELTGKWVSESTLKRFLKAAGYSWKRINKTMTDRRDHEAFEVAQAELQDFKEQHRQGEIELWFFDEAGFDGQPSVPYAWQPPGETLVVPSSRTKRINVLGFLTQDHQFESFCFTGTVNTDVVIACFDEFVRQPSSTTRIVILDQAPTHTSYEFLAKLADWETKGVFLKTLPSYCSELNLIEILWRFVKYSWLPFSAYLSFDRLDQEWSNVLKKIGSEFKINFACQNT